MFMIKTFRLFLLSALAIVFGSMYASAQESKTVTWLSSSGDALNNPIYVGDDLVFTWYEGSGDQAPMYSENEVRLFKNNYFVIAGASEDVKISQIFFAFGNRTQTPGFASSVGSNSNSYADNTTTWTGDANSIKFTANGAKYLKYIEVTYTGSAASVEKAPVLAITQDNIADTYNMDTNGVFVVYYENQGNAAAENAKLALFVDGTENASKTIGTLNAGASNLNFWNAKYNLEGLAAGEHQVYLSLTADNAEEVKTEVKTVTFTKSAPEPTFTLTAQPVEVQLPAEKFDVVATISSNMDAENVEVKLFYNTVIATQTVNVTAAQPVTVTFADVANPFTAAGEYTMYVQAPKTNAAVTVNVLAAPVVDQIDMAITAIQGAAEIDLDGVNTYKVWYKNEGNVKVENVDIILLVNDNEAGRQAVTVEPGQQGSVEFTLDVTTLFDPIEDLGLDATLIGMVNVEGDVNADNNRSSMTATVIKQVAEATFEVSAQDVEVDFGTEKFNVTATVKNTSEVAAENVEVKLFYNGVVATQTIASLAAGAETAVTFADVQNPFTTAGEHKMYVIVGRTQAEVKVTVKPEPVVEVIDMAITAIQGLSEINLKAENKAQVWYENKGNTTITTNIVLLVNDNEAGVQQVTVEAGRNGFVEFTIDVATLIEPNEDTEVTLTAMVNTEGDVDATNNTVEKTVPVVSGETEPTAEIYLNPIRGWEVSAGEQEISISVSVFNQGEADAKNLKIQLYENYPTILAEQTVDVKAGGYKMLTFKFNYTFEQGKSYDFTVFANYADSNAEDNMRTFTMTCPAPVAEVAIAKIADIEASTEEDVVIAATLTNTSNVDAAEVKVGVYTVNDSYQYQLVGFQQVIETIAAGEQASVEFNLGKLAEGTYKYYVRVVSVNGNASTTQRDLTVKVTAPVEPVIDMAIEAIQGLSEIKLNGENKAQVWYKNNGNVKMENVAIMFSVNDHAQEKTVTVEAGRNGFVEFTIPTDIFEPTEDTEAELVAWVNVEDDVNADNNRMSRTVSVVSGEVVAEPTLTLTAANVEANVGEDITFTVNVKNTSDVEAKDVTVQIFYGTTLLAQSQYSYNLASGEAVDVPFTIEKDMLIPAGIFELQAIAGNNSCFFTVTVKEVVEEVIDMAIIAIQGVSQIDLQTENKVLVWYENKSNVDLENVAIMFSVDENPVDPQYVDVKAGKSGYVEYTINLADFEVGEDVGREAVLEAWVNVEGDQNGDNNKVTRNVTIVNGVAPVATFEVSAQNVEIEFGTETFDVVATVKNVSEVDAEEVAVALFYNGVIATYTIETLAAGAEATVTFEVENPFTKAGDYTMYVQVPNTQTAVTITVKPEPVEEVIDMAITAIQGLSEINLTTENSVQVWYQNNSNVDLENVTILFSVNEETTQEQVVALIKAGANGYVMFDIDLADFEVTEIVEGADAMLTAWVNLDGDADRSNDKIQKLVPVVNGVAELSFEVDAVEAIQNAASFDVAVVVKNNGKAAAKNVVVTVYDENSAVLGTATIETIAAGAEATATIKVEKIYEEVGTFKNQLQVIVAGAGEAQWVDVTVTGIVDGIAAMKAMYGENVQIFTLSGKKVDSVRRGQVYIINGKKVAVK